MSDIDKALNKLQLAEVALDKAFYFEEWERDELPQLILDEIRNGRIATALTHVRSAVCDLDDLSHNSYGHDQDGQIDQDLEGNYIASIYN